MRNGYAGRPASFTRLTFRLGSVAEVADVIYFLCSDGSSYVNGTEIEINGGQHV